LPALAPVVEKVTGVCVTPAGQALEMSMSSPLGSTGSNVVVTPGDWFQPSTMACALKASLARGRNLPLLADLAATRTAASAAFLVSDWQAARSAFSLGEEGGDGDGSEDADDEDHRIVAKRQTQGNSGFGRCSQKTGPSK
jgi:hypothetical protein